MASGTCSGRPTSITAPLLNDKVNMAIFQKGHAQLIAADFEEELRGSQRLTLEVLPSRSLIGQAEMVMEKPCLGKARRSRDQLRKIRKAFFRAAYSTASSLSLFPCLAQSRQRLNISPAHMSFFNGGVLISIPLCGPHALVSPAPAERTGLSIALLERTTLEAFLLD